MSLFEIYAIAAGIASVIILGLGAAFYVARSRPKKRVEWTDEEPSRYHGTI